MVAPRAGRLLATLVGLMLAGCQPMVSAPAPVPGPIPPVATPSPPLSRGTAPARQFKSVGEFANLYVATSGKKGQAVPVVLTFSFLNGCEGDARARAVVDETTKTVTFEAQAATFSDDTCTGMGWYAEAGATFVPQGTGTYRVRAKIRPSPGSGAGTYGHFDPPIAPESADLNRPALDVELRVQISE